MKLFIVVKAGVYDQGVVGVFDSKAKAELGIKKAKENEKDDYHHLNIHVIHFNTKLKTELN